MSTGIHGHGTTLSIGGTAIGQIVSISGPNQKRDSIDISNMGSTSKWREFIPGMLDAGDASFDVVYDGTSIASTLDTLKTAAAATVTITFIDGGSWAASGFITELGHQIPYDDKITQSVAIKFTGAATAAP